MNPNNKFVITINRELGSGGRTVGRKLAEKLNVEYFDKAVIKALQERYNLSVEQIENIKGQETGWWAEFKRKMTFSESEYELNRTDIETIDVFRAETRVLKELAQNNSCVIAGRTACYIFREHPNHLSIFIQSSMPCRMARVAREQNMSKEDARLTIEKVDKMRENYVQEFTGTSRYDTRNYDLVINMDEISEDSAVSLILAYIHSMEQ
ncbi:MAG: cytidylate kinase-like family protein [Paludibacteraceae bacterium]|nr:cytidylate kinase-like family protein [Paludibacteraceae bacterium]